MPGQDIPDVERLLESNDILHSEEGYEDMVNVLMELSARPLNVNTADFDSLKMLVFLSDNQIDNILSFRKKYGVFLHPDELLLVTGIGKKELENIRPFIFVEKGVIRERMKAVRSSLRQEMIGRIKVTAPRQEGYRSYSREDFRREEDFLRKQDSRFRGAPVGALIKYKVEVNTHLTAGVTLENDAGEPYFTRYQRTGFDFLSAHVSMTTDRFFRRIILGDYKLQWGQGVMAWGGFSSGKSAVALGNEKSGKGLAPYTSTDENNFLRGIALSLQPARNLVTDLFFSYKKRDGNIPERDSLAEEELQRFSLYETGYHRSYSECLKKQSVKEMTAGVSVRLNTDWFRIGVNGLYYNFAPEIAVGDQPYQQFNDRGAHRFLMGVDYKTGFQNFYLFGETAVSDNKALATVNGLRFSGSGRVALCLVYRRYDKRYISHYAGGFGEYSNTSNEEGVYMGMELTPVKNMKVNVYYDWFRFFAPRYRAFIPGSGREVLCDVVYRHSDFEHTLYFKNEEKPEDVRVVAMGSRPVVRNTYRYQFSYRHNQQLELRTRCNFSRYVVAGRKESGYMVSQDVICSAREGNCKVQFRLAYFDTDSYNSRIYSYEHNVLYGYSFPAFSGRGFRTYLNLNWKPDRRVTFYLKAGATVYPGRGYLSSSVTRVEGNKLFDMAFQVRVKL